MIDMQWMILEAKAAEIDRQIAELERERRRVLCEDLEYGQYIEDYETANDGDTTHVLSIREFHRLSSELYALNEEIPSIFAREFDSWWNKHKPRILELERLLAA